MASVNKTRSVRLQSLWTRRSFQKFGFIKNHDCVVNLVNVFSEQVYFSHVIQRDHICYYFDKKQSLVQQIYPYLGLGFIMNAAINKYSNISTYLTVSKGSIENQQINYVLFSLQTESSKFWSVNYTKILASIYFSKSYLL